MAQTAGGGGDSRTAKYTRHPRGTRWAYFDEPGRAGHKMGWVRVGSQRWKDLHSPNYNNNFGKSYPKPKQLKTSRWNPGSPQYRSLQTQKGSGGIYSNPVHANHGKFKSDVGLARSGNRAAALRAQNWLHTHGHPGVKVDGVWGSKSNAAAKVALSGKYNPAGDGQKGSRTGVDPPKNPPKKPPVDPQNQLAELGRMIGNPNIGKMMPKALAKTLAGLQFDSQIHDVQNQQMREGLQKTQDLHDIANWYGQAKDLSHQAGVHAATVANQVADANAATTQSLLAALGGGGGSGGMIAAQGDAQAAMQRVLGQVQSDYQSNNQGALAAAQAGAEGATAATHSQNANDLALKLADLIGQKGQARSQFLMDFIDKNNALAQQRFTNRLSELEGSIGAQASLGNIQLQNIAKKRAVTDLNAARIANQQGAGASHVPWAKLDAGTQYKLAMTWLQGPNKTMRTPQQAYNIAKAQRYGGDPNVLTYLQSLSQH